MNVTSKPLYLLGFFILGLVVFSPCLKGTPIWDDSLIFDRYESTPEINLIGIWKNHLWPFFDSATFLLFKLIKHNYFLWHLISFILHFTNCYLLIKFLKDLKFKNHIFVGLVFFLHPLNVISVGWIFQLKTLLSFFFMLLSLQEFQKINSFDKYKSIFFAPLLMFFSLASKSNSLPLFVIYFGHKLLRKNYKIIDLISLSLFLIVTVIVLYLISQNNTFIINTNNSTQELQTIFTVFKNESLSPWGFKFRQIIFSLTEYLTLPLYPSPLTPLRGAFIGQYGKSLFLIMLLTFHLFYVHRTKDYIPVLSLLISTLAILPLCGFISLPVMSYSAISDQHFYFILPFMVLTMVPLIRLAPEKYAKFIKIFFLIIYSFMSFQYAATFRSAEKFFSQANYYNPTDPYIITNYAASKFKNNKKQEGLRILTNYQEIFSEKPPVNQHPQFKGISELIKFYQLQK